MEASNTPSAPHVGRVDWSPDYESARRFADANAVSIAARERLFKTHVAVQREDWEFANLKSVGGVYLTPAQAAEVREFFEKCDRLFSVDHELYDDAYALRGLFPV